MLIHFLTLHLYFGIVYLMNEIDYAYIVWLGIAVWGAYKIGKREGISATLDYMKENKHIDFED